MEVYGLLASGYGDWPIIKQIAWLLGQVMNVRWCIWDTEYRYLYHPFYNRYIYIDDSAYNQAAEVF